MKKLIISLAVVSAIVSISSCGSKGPSDEEILANLEPPFTVTGVVEKLNEQDEDGVYRGNNQRLFFTFNLEENGMYTFTGIQQNKDQTNFNEWYSEPKDTANITGRWTTRTRVVGENEEKVYVLHNSNGGEFAYIPADMEYIWLAKSWTAVENLDISSADRIAEITTPKGTVVRIKEEELLAPDNTPEAGNLLIGKTFQSVDSVYSSRRVSLSSWENVLSNINTKTITFTPDSVIVEQSSIDLENPDWNSSQRYSLKVRHIGNVALYYPWRPYSLEKFRVSEDGKVLVDYLDKTFNLVEE